MMTLTVVLYQMWFQRLRKLSTLSGVWYEDNDFSNVFLYFWKKASPEAICFQLERPAIHFYCPLSGGFINPFIKFLYLESPG